MNLTPDAKHSKHEAPFAMLIKLCELNLKVSYHNFIMFELLLFIILGIVIGIFFGLAPGLHPNLIVLMIPFFISLNAAPLSLIAFVVSIAVVNTIVDFIPSILLGAPDAGTELTVLPGHRMLLAGHGYEAVKLAVIGSVGAVIFCTLLSPLLIVGVPLLYAFLKPHTWILLIVIVGILILSEKRWKKVVATACFFMAGAIGVMSNSLPLDNSLLLFPLLSGLFGMSTLLLQLKTKTKIPKQEKGSITISRKTINRSVILGSAGGIFSGLLPGVGSSQIAAIASVDKNEKSFLMTNGSITMANIIMSIMSLWLIARPRSGVAVALSQMVSIGFNEFLFIVFCALAVCGVAAVVTLFIARKFVGFMEKINYSAISIVVIFVIIVLAFLFTGFYGLFLLALCTCLGIFTNLANVRRSVLMGVLILPAILFYLPV
jgi:putative membrane protein